MDSVWVVHVCTWTYLHVHVVHVFVYGAKRTLSSIILHLYFWERVSHKIWTHWFVRLSGQHPLKICLPRAPSHHLPHSLPLVLQACGPMWRLHGQLRSELKCLYFCYMHLHSPKLLCKPRITRIDCKHDISSDREFLVGETVRWLHLCHWFLVKPVKGMNDLSPRKDKTHQTIDLLMVSHCSACAL